MPASRDWMTVREAAAELQLDIKTIRNRIQGGEISGYKSGHGRTSPYRIPRREFARYVASLKVAA